MNADVLSTRVHDGIAVNRALPDAQLNGFVDALARRIASFDRRAIAAAKNLVSRVRNQ